MELAVVLAIIVLLGVMLAPAVKRAQQKAWRIECIGRIEAMGIAYRLWAADHGGHAPYQTSITNGGWSELLRDSNAGQYCWTNFAILKDDMGEAPQIVICPADERKPASNFIVKGSTNDIGNAAFKDNTTVSYFVGVTANDTYPQSIVGGDRNLGPGLVPDPNYGYSPADGKGKDVVLFTNSPVTWSLTMHSRRIVGSAGNILLGDGSAQQVSSASFRQNWLPNAQTGTNFSGTNQPGIRLVFP